MGCERIGNRRILDRLCNGSDNFKFTHFRFDIHLTMVVGTTAEGWRGRLLEG